MHLNVYTKHLFMFRVKLILMHIYIYTAEDKVHPYKKYENYVQNYTIAQKYICWCIEILCIFHFFINCISIIKLILQVTKAI